MQIHVQIYCCGLFVAIVKPHIGRQEHEQTGEHSVEASMPLPEWPLDNIFRMIRMLGAMDVVENALVDVTRDQRAGKCRVLGAIEDFFNEGS